MENHNKLQREKYENWCENLNVKSWGREEETSLLVSFIFLIIRYYGYKLL